jgi:hypothetical protein
MGKILRRFDVVLLGMIALVLLGFPYPAGASCGATSCFLVIGSQAGVPQKGMMTVNLFYNYVNQNQLVEGTSGVIPEIDTDGRLMVLDHHKETSTINQIYTLDLNYGVTDRFALQVTMPYRVLSHRHFHFHMGQPIEPSLFTDNGLGDVRVTAKYNVLPTLRSLLVFGTGVELPTGKYQTQVNEGGSTQEPTVQLGRGNAGLVGSVYQSYELIPHRLNQFSSLAYRHTFKNDLGYQFGDEYLLSVGLNFRALEKLVLIGQFNYRYVVHDEFSSAISGIDPVIRDRPVPTTGSTMLAFSPGFLVNLGQAVQFYFNAQIPVVRDFNGNLGPDVGFVAGFTHMVNLGGS